MSKKEERCLCSCEEECNCGNECHCGDECNCGNGCHCGEECNCGNECHCHEESCECGCDCGCDCGCEDECGCDCGCEDECGCDCGCEDECGCDCGCEDHHVNEDELKDRVEMLVDAYSTSELNIDNILTKGMELDSEEKYKEAIEFFTDAAILGSGPAMYYLGKYALEGLAGNKDEKKAKMYLEASSKLGCSNAIYLLGDIYRYGIGIEANPERGVALYQTAFDLAFYSKNPDSMPEAAYRLGKELLTGEVAEQNVEDGEFLLNIAASMFKDKLEFDKSVQKELDDCEDLLSRIIEED